MGEKIRSFADARQKLKDRIVAWATADKDRGLREKALHDVFKELDPATKRTLKLVDDVFDGLEAGLREKKVVWVDHYQFEGIGEEHTQEDLLRDNALVAEVWLADYDADDITGDDWNDAPAFCNAGPPYKEKLRNLEIVKVRLGKPLHTTLLARECEEREGADK